MATVERGYPCHETCSELLRTKIEEIVSNNLGNAQVDAIIARTKSSDESQNSGSTISEGNCVTQSFVVTVKYQCFQENACFSTTQEDSDVLGDTSDLSVMYKDNFVDIDATQVSSEMLQAFTEGSSNFFSDLMDHSSDEEIAAINSQYSESPIDGDIFYVECDDLPEADTSPLNDDEITDNKAAVTVYPLTTSKLHETIEQQLDKGSSRNSGEWSSSLFKEFATASATTATSPVQSQTIGTNQQQQPFMANEPALTQSQNLFQQQSNEISSSTWDYQSTSSVNQICQRDFYSFTQSAVGFSTTQGMNLSPIISMPQQQIFCPANLPPVSTLMNGGVIGGNSMNWTLARQPSTNKAAFVRFSKSVQQKQAEKGYRPSMLLPKTVLPCPTQITPVNAKARSRKTSLTSSSQPAQARTVATASSSHAPVSRHGRAPEGHTYESFILQEGLVKIRNQQKQEKKRRIYHRGTDRTALGDGASHSSEITGKTNVRYVCPICGKSYGSANGIKYHAENGHGPKRPSHKCDICDKEYSSRHGLAAHKLAHRIRAAAEAPLLEDEMKRIQERKQKKVAGQNGGGNGNNN